MITRDALLTLYDYNTYANHLVLDAVGQLSEAEQAHQPARSHGSIRHLLLHMLAVEAGYLANCQERVSDRPDLVSLPELRRFWDDVARRMRAYIAALDEAGLARPATISIAGQELRFPVWQMLLQACMHSAHHRGELAILLGERGHPPATLDIIVHFARQSGQPWPAA